MTLGTVLAIVGAGVAVILAGIGSILGVQLCGKTAAGVAAEQPNLFGKLLVLQILPGTQGLYGFMVAFLLFLHLGMLGGTFPTLSTELGWAYFGACVPIAINGLVSGIFQGRVAASGILMTAKQPKASGKAITMAVLVETYAILSLVVSIILIFALPLQ